MRKFNFSLFFLFSLITMTLQSCEAIGGIFKAGMWFGVSIVLIVVVGIIWLLNRSRK